jgi:hypothetical protein
VNCGEASCFANFLLQREAGGKQGGDEHADCVGRSDVRFVEVAMWVQHGGRW